MRASILLTVCSLIGFCFHNAYANIPIPDPTPNNELIKIKTSSETRSLNSSLKIDRNGNKVLEIRKNEAVEFTLPKDVVLQSTSDQVVAVINGSTIVGITENATAVITAMLNKSLFQMNGTEAITVLVLPADETPKINSTPTFLSYKVVKDAFGKGIAEYFFVVQVNISNSYSDKQYLLQDVSVLFDPKQCRVMKEYFVQFEEDQCIDEYKKYFAYPTTISPIDREAILGVADTEKYRSKRYLLMQSMEFLATVGGGLTGFNLLGSDAVKGFSFLGNGFKGAVDTALPKVAEEKHQRLRNSLPDKAVLVGSRSNEKINIFIPADRVFTYNTWRMYKQSVKKKPKKRNQEYNGAEQVSYKTDTVDATVFRRWVQLFLLATSRGVLIDDNNQTAASQGGGAIDVQEKTLRP